MTTTQTLSVDQVASFRDEGYLVYSDQVFPPASFEALSRHFEAKLESLPADARPEHMDVPHFTDPKLFEWLFADEVLDLVEPIVGPDIALFSSHFICKRAGDGKRVPWHEDSYYWREMIAPMEVCTVWLAVDPSTRSNGCMKVIPGTHVSGDSDYDGVDRATNVFGEEIVKPQRDESKAVPIELAPGQASLHDARLMHGSDPNVSDQRRCGFTMRYMSTRVKVNREKIGDYHVVYLARGRDLSGNSYADPQTVYDDLLKKRNAGRHKIH